MCRHGFRAPVATVTPSDGPTVNSPAVPRQRRGIKLVLAFMSRESTTERPMHPRLIPERAVPGAIEIPLEKSSVTIGRTRQTDFVLEDPSVSRIHATIRLTHDGYVIEDNGSMHGTRVNGKPVTSQQLHNDDLIDIGVYRFRFV